MHDTWANGNDWLASIHTMLRTYFPPRNKLGINNFAVKGKTSLHIVNFDVTWYHRSVTARNNACSVVVPYHIIDGRPEAQLALWPAGRLWNPVASNCRVLGAHLEKQDHHKCNTSVLSMGVHPSCT